MYCHRKLGPPSKPRLCYNAILLKGVSDSETKTKNLLWKTINDDLSAADTSPGRRRRTPNPEAIYREAEPALITLASQ
ncbi:MAG: hypothetical protein OYL97_13245 [Candidatus Poribacteria bacterium]|nr:hypothetical protein [Candidatus Poribacteria bacterium]